MVVKLLNLGWYHRLEIRFTVRRLLPISAFVSSETEDVPRVLTGRIHSKADKKTLIYGKSMEKCRQIQDWLLESTISSEGKLCHNAEMQLIVET